MNPNPSAKTILCYGDSNTYGLKADWVTRHPANVRWTGVLQQKLGADYYVIEEGLSGRTTDVDYATRPGRNGKTYLWPCLNSHAPLDVVVIMLGTNDLKVEFNRSTKDIAEAIRGLVQLVRERAADYGYSPAIILVSPLRINETASNFSKNGGYFDHESVVKSQQLAAGIQSIAEQTDCTFVDAAEAAKAAEDGIHFDEASHQAFGELMVQELHKLGFAA